MKTKIAMLALFASMSVHRLPADVTQSEDALSGGNSGLFFDRSFLDDLWPSNPGPRENDGGDIAVNFWGAMGMWLEWQPSWIDPEPAIADFPIPAVPGGQWSDLVAQMDNAFSLYNWHPGDLFDSSDFTTFLRDSREGFHKAMAQKMREGKAEVERSTILGPLNEDEARKATQRSKQIAEVERYVVAGVITGGVAVLTKSVAASAAAGTIAVIVTSGIEGTEFKEGDFVICTTYSMEVNAPPFSGWEKVRVPVHEFTVIHTNQYFTVHDEVGQWMNNEQVVESMSEVMDNPRLADADGIRIFRGVDGKIHLALTFP